MRDDLAAKMKQQDSALLISSMEKEFGTTTYSLWHLFRDAQRETLFRLLESTLEEQESTFRQIYREQIKLIHAMREMRIPVPKVFEDPAWYILNRDLNAALSGTEINRPKIQHLVSEMILGGFAPDRNTLDFTASKLLAHLTKGLVSASDDIAAMQEVIDIFRILAPLALSYDLWESQNDYFYCGRKQLGFMQHLAEKGDPRAARWISRFEELGSWLGVKCT
jgi:hypothetical protein